MAFKHYHKYKLQKAVCNKSLEKQTTLYTHTTFYIPTSTTQAVSTEGPRSWSTRFLKLFEREKKISKGPAQCCQVGAIPYRQDSK